MSVQAINAKKDLVKSTTENLKKAKSFIVFEYRGMTAKEITELRTNLYKAGAKMYVLKNNILSRSLQECSFNELKDVTGPNAVVMGFEDELAAIKEVFGLTKNFDFITIKGAYLESKFLSPEEVKAIANIPSREGLYAMFLSCLTSPIRSVLYGLKAVAEKK